MIDNFLGWFWERILDFGDWFKQTIGRAFDLLTSVLAWITIIFLIVLLFPLWILPFIYWFVFVRNKEVENE